jgi:F0F1-type ATP synthase assembly protein I
MQASRQQPTKQAAAANLSDSDDDEDDDNDDSRVYKSADRLNVKQSAKESRHNKDQTRHRSVKAYATDGFEVALYLASGILLIFMMETFVQMGSRMRY